MRKFLTFLLIFLSLPIPSSQAAELSEILKRDRLIVAIKDNLPPLGYYNAQGQLVGFEIDIAQRLAAEILGDATKIQLQSVKNQDRLQVVMNEQVDIAIAHISFSESRNRLVDFSPYYYLNSTGIISKNPTLNLRQLTSAKIAVLYHSSTIAVIREALPQATLIGVNSYQEALSLLEQDKAIAFAGDNTVLTGWVQEYPRYTQLPLQLAGEALCIVMPKGLQYRHLRTKINEIILRWQQSGWLEERATYWGLP